MRTVTKRIITFCIVALVSALALGTALKWIATPMDNAEVMRRYSPGAVARAAAVARDGAPRPVRRAGPCVALLRCRPTAIRRCHQRRAPFRDRCVVAAKDENRIGPGQLMVHVMVVPERLRETANPIVHYPERQCSRRPFG